MFKVVVVGVIEIVVVSTVPVPMTVIVTGSVEVDSIVNVVDIVQVTDAVVYITLNEVVSISVVVYVTVVVETVSVTNVVVVVVVVCWGIMLFVYNVSDVVFLKMVVLAVATVTVSIPSAVAKSPLTTHQPFDAPSESIMVITPFSIDISKVLPVESVATVFIDRNICPIVVFALKVIVFGLNDEVPGAATIIS